MTVYERNRLEPRRDEGDVHGSVHCCFLQFVLSQILITVRSFAPCVKSLGRHGSLDQMQLLLSIRNLLARQALRPECYMGIDHLG